MITLIRDNNIGVAHHHPEFKNKVKILNIVNDIATYVFRTSSRKKNILAGYCL